MTKGRERSIADLQRHGDDKDRAFDRAAKVTIITPEGVSVTKRAGICAKLTSGELIL